MTPSEKVSKKIALEAKKDKRRIVLSIIGLLICLGILYQLNNTIATNETTQNTQIEHDIDVKSMLPKFDPELLNTIKDSTDSEQVILEPEPFAATAYNAGALITSWVFLLGEPELDFLKVQQNPSPFRGEIFRIRGKLLHTETISRIAGEEPEYWSLIEDEQKQVVFFAGMTAPDTLFSHDGDIFVLADGYFYKNYRKKINGEWVTAPLLIGNKLISSTPLEKPKNKVDFKIVRKVQDHPIGTHNDPTLLNEMQEMWHLANVAQEWRRSPELAKEHNQKALLLDFEMLKKLVDEPELYRGQVFELGGEVVESHTGRAKENPIRSREISSAWLRNSFLGDTLLHVKSAGKMPFNQYQGNSIMRGFFLMLWAYTDTQSKPRRAPVFIVYETKEQMTTMPQGTHFAIYAFLGFVTLLGGLLFWIARRDSEQQKKAMIDIQKRRRKRHESK